MNIFQIVTRLLTICIYFSTWFAAFISIDFGSSDSEPYTDENSITWTEDDAYIQSGESQFLKYSTMPYVRDEQSQGVLIAEKKNCYKINVNEGEWVLVRASFYYGDYDLKFSLQFLTFNLMTIIWPLSTLRTCMILFLMGQYILWKQTILAFVLLKQCLTKCHSYQHLSSGACFLACIAKLLPIMLCS